MYFFIKLSIHSIFVRFFSLKLSIYSILIGYFIQFSLGIFSLKCQNCQFWLDVKKIEYDETTTPISTHKLLNQLQLCR